MDMRSWKKILLQWITKCGFTERNYFNIEQSDIELFFRNFRKRHPRANVRGASDSSSHSCMIIFLREFYPDFHPNLDDEGSLSASDYIYVYSLFLHFSCVKYPESFFHECCQNLSEHNQAAIAAFFKELLELSCIKREFLRHAIAECAIAHTSQSPSQHNESTSSSCSSGASGSGSGGQRSLSCSVIDATSLSPSRTPKRQTGGPHRVSASTPKSYMLEERTRELYNLRAQLETERYEKGLLEVQIKQNEEKIHKLNSDHRKLRQHIHELKNDILAKNNDNSSPNRDDDREDQIKRRLCRELSQKEDEVTKLTDVLSALKEDNNLVEEKLTFAEKQIILCMERIKELDCRVDELNTELEQKIDTIKYLTDNKLELEQFIAETRSAAGGARPDLNSTGEGMDGSFGPNMNSSGSINSPENLGRSVVDKQLREQEYENMQLRDELCAMRAASAHILKQLQKLALRHAQEFGLRIDNIPAKEEECVDLADYLTMFTHLMDALSRHCKEEKCAALELQEHANKMQATNVEISRKLSAFEKETVQLRKNAKLLDEMSSELQQGKQVLQERLNQREQELETLSRKKTELSNKFDALSNDYQMVKLECETQSIELNAKIEKLQTELELSNASNAQLGAKKSQIEELLKALQVELQSMQLKDEQRSDDYASEMQALSDKLAQQHDDLVASRAAQHAVKEKYEKLLVSSEAMKRDKRATDDHLETMRNEIARKEMEMGKLGVEIVQVCEKNKQLEARINTLVNEYRTEKDIAEVALSERDQCIKEIGVERQNLQSVLENANAEKETLRSELKNSQEQLRAVSGRVQALSQMLQAPGSVSGTFNADLNSCNIVTALSAVVGEVKALKAFRLEAVNRIESLEFDNIESGAQLHQLEEQYRNLHEEKDRLLEALAKENRSISELELMRLKFNDSEAKLSKVQDTLAKERETREKELTKSVQEACVEYINALHSLEEELHAEREFRDSKEQEYQEVVGEHNAIAEKLEAAERQMELMIQQKFEFHSEHATKFDQMSAKVNRMAVENQVLNEEMTALKQLHEETEQRQILAEKELEKLSGQLSEEHSSKTALDLKLMQSAELLVETEERLETLLDEKSKAVLSLESTCARQTRMMQRTEEKLRALERLRIEQLETIEGLQQRIQELSEEQTAHANELKNEQAEKLVLLTSLEKTADQLTAAQAEQAKSVEDAEQRHAELSVELAESSTACVQLQAELSAKEAQLQLAAFEQQQASDDFQSRVSELLRKLAENSLERETIDNAMIEMIAVLENANLSLDLTAAVNGDPNAANGDREGEGDVAEAADTFFSTVERPNNDHFTKLRRRLGQMLVYVSQLRERISEAEERRQRTAGHVDVLTQSNSALSTEITQNRAEISELQQMLAEEAKALENKLGNEVRRLNEDIQNLEGVNVRLTGENATLQCKLTTVEEEAANVKLGIHLLIEEKTKLTEENTYKAEINARLKQEEKKLNDSIKDRQAKIDKLEEVRVQHERQLKERATRITTLEKDLQAGTERERALKTKLQQSERKIKTTENDLTEAGEKLRTQRTAQDTLESDLARKNKELVAMQAKLKELSAERTQLEEQCKAANKKLDDSITERLAVEDERDEKVSQLQQVRRDYDFSKQQLQQAVEDMDRFMREIDELKKEKAQLGADLKDHKRDLQRANDNITELIQQISSIRIEKEASVDENGLLRKQLEQSGRNQTLSETLERQLLAAENELKSIRANLEQSEGSAAKLADDNRRLNEMHDSVQRRCEQIALQLGETQARCAKHERDHEKLSKSAATSAATVEILQREKSTMLAEAKKNREQITQSQRCVDQLLSKVQTLENSSIALAETKQKLETSELEFKAKITKLEKMREINDEKLRKLDFALNTSEQANVRLNLEVGALNSELVEIKSSYGREVAEVQQQLIAAKHQSTRHFEHGERLKAETQHLREQNSQIAEQLAKVSVSLQISKDKCDALEAEMQQMRFDLSNIREEKRKVEREHAATCGKVNDHHMQNEHKLNAKRQAVEELRAKVASLEAELSLKNCECYKLKGEIGTLRKQPVGLDAADITELESLRRRLTLAVEVLEREQKTTAQLRLDNQILQAKYRDSKQRALTDGKLSEDRIKENRLELEGKLEKMKNKMKTLYTEEITKMKTKQERETVVVKTEMDALKSQNTKYEEHNRKLSNQLVRLNDKILELQKNNAFLSTKIKHLGEEHDSQATSSFKRPNSIHGGSSTSTGTLGPMTAPAAPKNVGINLAMEDEEGEVFNNTYLTDLKTGHMSDLMGRDICVEELQYRNSMVPPHLKSAYAAQYEHGLPEDELKDGALNLDDSMSALLSTTAGGTRKKVGGVTHYKRPGPPTPSKNGGRLSFGGLSEQSREILKESFDSNAGTSASSKTPARFGFFASRFSMGNPKDEIHRRDLRKVLQKRNMRKVGTPLYNPYNDPEAGVLCTSTPRQSQAHLEQRRLFDRMMQYASSTPTTGYLNSTADSNDLSLFTTPIRRPPPLMPYPRTAEQICPGNTRRHSAIRRRLSMRLQAPLLTPTPPALAVMQSLLNTGRQTSSSSGSSAGVDQYRRRVHRTSLNLCGNIFMKNALRRDTHRNAARKQRSDQYNCHRDLESPVPSAEDEEPTGSSANALNVYHLYDINRNELSARNAEGTETKAVVPKATNDAYDYDNDDDRNEDASLERAYAEYSRELDRYLKEQMAQQTEVPRTPIKLQEIDTTDEEDETFNARFDMPEAPKGVNNYKEKKPVMPSSNRKFEEILAEMESRAPFQVRCVQYGPPIGSLPLAQASQSSSDGLPSTSGLSIAACSTAISAPSIPSIPHSPSSAHSSSHLSRIIYGGSVIYNRRLPRVNTTYVRKSSIYVQNRDPTAHDDIILVTDQTITLIDILRMWKQMNSLTRLFVGFAGLASLTTLIGLFIVFCSAR